jgi:death on curing protein
MDNPTWVPRVAVMAAHLEQLREHGGLQGIRDPNGLEAALARPEQKNWYQEDVDSADLAAAYAYGLAKGHCFVDGNKRVGLAVALIFLELNGLELTAEVTSDDVVAVMLATASGEIDEVVLAQWFRERIVPLSDFHSPE